MTNGGLGWGRWLGGLLAGALVLGCTTSAPRTPAPPAKPPLRVGVDPGSPPLIFLRDNGIVGLEADFAARFAADQGRPLRFFAYEWSQLIPALLDGRIDVIMSGMTATEAREVRVAFANPYLESGLMALVRRGDAQVLSSPEAIQEKLPRIGVKQGTTSEAFVRDRYQWSEIALYPTSYAAVTELLQRRIDVYVGDAPMVVWQASQHESDLVPIRKLLTREPLAWAFRRDDDALRAAANASLAQWKADGSLNQMIRRWMPYWPGLE